jgi:glutathione S-transferase
MADGSEILFHNYAMSPFSEKIRKIFAFKKIAYRSVEQPMWMPKPQLTPLTGGYRRIPVMQIGADVYCDTALIARKLEQLAPKPSLYPDGNVGAAEAVAAWADRQLFMICVPIVFGALGEVLPRELIEDRKRMRADLDVAQLRAAAPQFRAALAAWCSRLDHTLRSRKHLLGGSFSLADAAVYHCLWFVRNEPEAAGALARFPALADWIGRIDAMGAGESKELAAGDALAVAAACEPKFAAGVADDDPAGLAEGASVGVFADDLPSDVISGRLAAASADEIVLLREDADRGKVAVHFPRVGYFLRPAS